MTNQHKVLLTLSQSLISSKIDLAEVHARLETMQKSMDLVAQSLAHATVTSMDEPALQAIGIHIPPLLALKTDLI